MLSFSVKKKKKTLPPLKNGISVQHDFDLTEFRPQTEELHPCTTAATASAIATTTTTATTASATTWGEVLGGHQVAEPLKGKETDG